jgi:hypothetical protein
MNTKSLLTRIGVPVLSLGLLGGIGATLATSASASTVPGTVHAVTHSPQHLDTTTVKTGTDSPNGPVWAYDNLTDQFTVVPASGDGNYQVTIDSTGSFKGFADPMTGAPLASSGPVKGTIEYNVHSTRAPDPKALPSQEPDGTSTGVMIGQLFGETDGLSIFNPAHVGPAEVTGGGDYTFSYQNGNYVQDTNGIRGVVTGH